MPNIWANLWLLTEFETGRIFSSFHSYLQTKVLISSQLLRYSRDSDTIAIAKKNRIQTLILKNVRIKISRSGYLLKVDSRFWNVTIYLVCFLSVGEADGSDDTGREMVGAVGRGFSQSVPKEVAMIVT